MRLFFFDDKLSIHFWEDKNKSIVFGTNKNLKDLRELDTN